MKPKNKALKDDKKIYSRFRFYAKKNNISQSYLMGFFGVNRQTISKYFNDHTRPSVEMSYKFCDLVGITIDQLYFRE